MQAPIKRRRLLSCACRNAVRLGCSTSPRNCIWHVNHHGRANARRKNTPVRATIRSWTWNTE